MQDKIGQEIKVGSIIAYGHALGRCAGLRIGKVLKLKESFESSYSYSTPRQIYRITVLGIDDDWAHKEIKLCSSKGCLQYPERIIVLDKTKLPLKYQTLLESIH